MHLKDVTAEQALLDMLDPVGLRFNLDARGLYLHDPGEYEPLVEKPSSARAQGTMPRVIATSPAVGAEDVDPSIGEITVTFDRDMGKGMSWTGGPPDFPPIPEGQRAHWRDARTCVLPVNIESGSYYRVGINSTSYQNFRSGEGVPAKNSTIYFTTQGASDELKRKLKTPRIISLDPPNGAPDVDPDLK